MSIDGTWHLVMGSPVGKQHVTAQLHGEDGRLTGTVTNDSNKLSAEIFDGIIDEDRQTWKVKLNQLRVTLVVKTTVADDTMTGEVKAGMFGKYPVTGNRA